MIPLYKPHMPELPELDDILHSGQLAYGIYAKQFEKALSDFIGIDSIWTTNSFNMSIEVAISLLDICPNDEIIASPMACLASTQPYAVHGITVNWADIDPLTGTLDPDSVRNNISKKTKAIVHNHFCGYLGYVDEINAIGKEYGIVVRDKNLYKKVELIRDCGIDRKKFRDNLGEINPDCDITLKGHSATMSNVNAYIGIRQMMCMKEILEQQRRHAEKWKLCLKEYSGMKLLDRAEILPNYWVYGVLAENKRKCIEKFREHGWYASGVHLNNNRYSLFGKQKELIGVEDFYNRYVAIPCGWWIGQADI